MTILAIWSDGWSLALVDHLWQSTVVAAIAWLMAFVLRRNPARTRYWVWMAASVKFLLPFSLLMMAGEWLRSLSAAPVAAEPVFANVVEKVAQPFSQAQFFDAMSYSSATNHSTWPSMALLAMWICGALVVAIRFGRGWWMVLSAKRAARPLELVADVRVLCSPALIEPGIFGIFRPVLLLPEGILEKLTPKQLKAIVAHEMCHVRRRDNLTFALHMVVEILFWFYPPVWWIGARLIDERERACDEEVLLAGEDAQDYAEGILNVCKFYVESPLKCVAGVTGADLKMRIVRILARHPAIKMGLSRKLLLGAAALLAVAVPVVVGWGQAQGAKVQLVHPENGVRYTFEVATIKPNLDPAPGLRFQVDPAHTAATHLNAYDLIKFAYGIKSDDQLVGAPSWLKTEYFDIQAKASGADIAQYDKLGSEERMKVCGLLLQSLLEDRFQLKARAETRDLPVYALVVANGGIKMKEVQMDPITPAGVPPAPGAHLPRITRTGKNEVTASAWPMGGMADWLSRSYEVGNRPVVDETRLAGNYDFVLGGVSLSPPPPDDGSSQDPGVSLFTALPEQLGLKLVPEKALTEVLVIDHIEQPSPN